jgi:hypothetical protein
MPPRKNYGTKRTTTIQTRSQTSIPMQNAVKVIVKPKPAEKVVRKPTIKKDPRITKTNKDTINAKKNTKLKLPKTTTKKKDKKKDKKKLKAKQLKANKIEKEEKKKQLKKDKEEKKKQAKQAKKDTKKDKQEKKTKKDTKKDASIKTIEKEETKKQKEKKEPAPSVHSMTTRSKGPAEKVPEVVNRRTKPKEKSNIPIADKVQEAKDKVEKEKKKVDAQKEPSQKDKPEKKVKEKTVKEKKPPKKAKKSKEEKALKETKEKKEKTEKPEKEKPSEAYQMTQKTLKGIAQKMSSSQPQNIQEGWRGWVGQGLQGASSAMLTSGNPYVMAGGVASFGIGALMNLWQSSVNKAKEKKQKYKKKHQETMNEISKAKDENEQKQILKEKNKKQKEKYKIAKLKLKGKEKFWINEEAKAHKYEFPMKQSLNMLNQRYRAYMAQRDNMMRSIGILEAERHGREIKAEHETQRDYRRYDIQQNIQKDANKTIFETQRKKADEDIKTRELRKVGIDRDKLHEGQSGWLQFNSKYVDKEKKKPTGIGGMSTQALSRYAINKMEDYSLRNNLKKYVSTPEQIVDTGLRMEDLLGIKYDAYDLEEINKSDVSFITKPERYTTLQQEAIKNAEWWRKFWDTTTGTVKAIGNIANLFNPIKGLVYDGLSSILPTFITNGVARCSNGVSQLKDWYNKVDNMYGADGCLAEWAGESIVNFLTRNELGVNYEKFLKERENNWLKEKYNRKSALETVMNGQPYSGNLKKFEKLKAIESRDSFLNALTKLDQYEREGRLRRETRHIPSWVKEKEDGSINGKKVVEDLQKSYEEMTQGIKKKIKKLKEANNQQIENIGKNLEKFGIVMNDEFRTVLKGLNSNRQLQYQQAIIQHEFISKEFQKKKKENEKLIEKLQKETDEKIKKNLQKQIQENEQQIKILENNEQKNLQHMNNFSAYSTKIQEERKIQENYSQEQKQKIKEKEEEARQIWIELHQELEKKEKIQEKKLWEQRIEYTIPNNPYIKKYKELKEQVWNSSRWTSGGKWDDFKAFVEFPNEKYKELDQEYNPNLTLKQQTDKFRELNDFYIWHAYLNEEQEFPLDYRIYNKDKGEWIDLQLGKNYINMTPSQYCPDIKQPERLFELRCYEKLYKPLPKQKISQEGLKEEAITGACKYLPSNEQLQKIQQKIFELGNDPMLKNQFELYKKTFEDRPKPIIISKNIEDIDENQIQKDRPIETETMKTFIETVKNIDPNDESGTRQLLEEIDETQKKLAEVMHLHPEISENTLNTFKYAGLSVNDTQEKQREKDRKYKEKEKLERRDKAIDQDVEALDYLYNLITGDIKGDQVFDMNKISSNDWRSVLFHYYSRKSPLAADILENANMIGPCIAKDKNGKPKMDKFGRPVYKLVDGRDTSQIRQVGPLTKEDAQKE